MKAAIPVVFFLLGHAFGGVVIGCLSQDPMEQNQATILSGSQRVVGIDTRYYIEFEWYDSLRVYHRAMMEVPLRDYLRFYRGHEEMCVQERAGEMPVLSVCH